MDDQSGPGPLVTSRLGYLLKHAHREMDRLSNEALAPLGIDARELGILLVIASHEPGSQQQVAERLGIDRTSMVAFVDSLESKGLLTRHPHPDDRRRNIVELTDAGHHTTRTASEVTQRAEATLLAALTTDQAQQLRGALQRILAPPG